MKFAIAILCLLAAVFLLMLPEVIWLIAICILFCKAALSARHPAIRWAMAALGIAFLTVHFAGFKIYGSATIRDNSPILSSPRRVASFAAPNIVVTTDGARYELRGITFTPDLASFSMESLSHYLNNDGEPLLIEADSRSPSGVVFQRRYFYFCGNTFFPTFFPARLPRYASSDLGEFLAKLPFVKTDNPVGTP